MKTDYNSNNKLLGIVFKLSLICNILVAITFVGKRFYYSHAEIFKSLSKTPIIPVNDSLATFTYNKIKSDAATYKFFKMLPNDTSDIIFLGNSLTAGFPLQEIFKNQQLKNRGISGNTSKNILQRLDEVTEGKPRKIFLEIGINDISNGVPVDTLLDNVKKIALNVKHQSPKTTLYIQSVFPTSLQAKRFVPMIEEYNREIGKFCKKENASHCCPSFFL